jgi:hypothetical protein
LNQDEKVVRASPSQLQMKLSTLINQTNKDEMENNLSQLKNDLVQNQAMPFKLPRHRTPGKDSKQSENLLSKVSSLRKIDSRTATLKSGQIQVELKVTEQLKSLSQD